jgi:hypothetical protein
MANIDLTVAVTAHDETVVAGPCMSSVAEAIASVEGLGVTVERLIALDAPTGPCADYFTQFLGQGWRIHQFRFRDPFKTRNAVAQLSSGRWLAFVDADDLVSENWFCEAVQRLRAAAARHERVIVHPEVNWIFEGAEVVFVKPAQTDELFLPHYFYFANYYDMMSVYPREAAMEVPYACRDVEQGFGYQDWQWNIETVSAGWRHVSVPDTVIFKRRRAGSISSQNRQRECVIRFTEPMAIDKIRAFGERART